jgi:hypothetical protein
VARLSIIAKDFELGFFSGQISSQRWQAPQRH